jgi:hypothetical protein
VRAACAFVAERAQLVRIDESGLAALAQAIAAADVEEPERLGLEFAVTFNAVNFGSGWHPHVDKAPAASGSVTMMSRLRRRFDTEGPFTAEELVRLMPTACAGVFGQQLRPPVDELMGLFARALNELGTFLLTRFEGSFDALVAAADGSAVRLVELLQEMPMYRDVASYDDRTVPFLKRAQITASDIGTLADLDRLTLFADNLIPHVLRLEGVLVLDRVVAEAIDAGRLLERGGRPETELRAAAVHAVELLVAQLGGAVTPRQVDSLLWRNGQEARFKACPRPRVRTFFY